MCPDPCEQSGGRTRVYALHSLDVVEEDGGEVGVRKSYRVSACRRYNEGGVTQRVKRSTGAEDTTIRSGRERPFTKAEVHGLALLEGF